jgi:MFS family permease
VTVAAYVLRRRLRDARVTVAAFLVVFPAPAFLMLDTRNTALIVLGFIFAAYGTVGSQAAAFAELAGSRYRYAAVALAREFSAVLGGGIAPLVSGVLVQLLAGWVGVVIYMMAIMVVTLRRRPSCARWARSRPRCAVAGRPAGRSGSRRAGRAHRVGAHRPRAV